MLCFGGFFANESKFYIIYSCAVADNLREDEGIRTDPRGFAGQASIQRFCLTDRPSQAVALVGLTKISLCSGNTGHFQLTNVHCSESWG